MPITIRPVLNRMPVGPLPALLLGLSMWLAWRFPINRAKHAQLRAGLAEHRAAT